MGCVEIEEHRAALMMDLLLCKYFLRAAAAVVVGMCVGIGNVHGLGEINRLATSGARRLVLKQKSKSLG